MSFCVEHSVFLKELKNGAWKDQLKSYNGQTIEYDGAGNPTSYLGKALTWKGRKLTGIAGLGMEYDYKGYRIKKGNKRYIWQEDRLIAEIEADEGEESFIYYNYDESGVSGMNVNGSEYYYRKNLQGDVIAVYDDNGHMECRYDYDAWGRHRCRLENGTVIYDSATGAVSGYEEHIGIRNAIRYRSYYWDSETGLYYLQSRYYDPEIGRFISPDDIEYLEPESIGGLNLYAYCFNNPVMYSDPSGHFAISTFLISLAIGSLISWGLSEIFGAQIVGGVGSIANGVSSILSSVSLFAFGPVGWVIGGIGIVAGLASIAFGTAEIQEGLGYGNWINDIGITGDLYTGLYIGSNIVSSLTTIGGNLYRNSRITSGASQADKTGRLYSRYYQMDGKNVKSITYYGKGGTPKYRIDVLGRPHNGVLPHKHNFVINNGFVNKGSVDGINYLLWLLFGNWR